MPSSFIPFQPDLKLKAQENRNNPTKAESKMWYEVLTNKNIGYRFLRQKPVHSFIVDFYCSKLKLVIEIDGDSHAENFDYDRRRTEILNQYKLKVIRYKNLEILKNLPNVFNDLFTEIEAREKELGL